MASPLPLMLLLTFIYAICFSAIKAGLVYAPPLRFAGLRALLGGLTLLGWALVRREEVLPRSTGLGSIAVLSLLATTIVFAAMFLSAGRTGAGIASILGNLQALFTMGLAAVFLSERWTGRKMIAMLIGLTGVALIAFPSMAGSGASGFVGPLLALTVSVGSAVSNIVVKRLEINSGLLAFTAWQLIAGSLPLLAGSAIFERGRSTDWTPEFLLLLLFLAFAGTSFVTAVWYRLIQREDVGRLSIFFYLVPPFGLGFAVLVFKEPLSGYEIAGSLLALASVGLAAVRAKE
jgi:O-acetylserine/cysteine efflux transporter